MEKKTNKAKLDIFIILRKSAIAYEKIGGNYALSANSTKNILNSVFLHAEFISAMKTVQNPMIFMKNAKKKKIEKWIILVLSVNCLRFSLKLLSRTSEKVRKCFFFRWKRRQIKQN